MVLLFVKGYSPFFGFPMSYLEKKAYQIVLSISFFSHAALDHRMTGFSPHQCPTPIWTLTHSFPPPCQTKSVFCQKIVNYFSLLDWLIDFGRHLLLLYWGKGHLSRNYINIGIHCVLLLTEIQRAVWESKQHWSLTFDFWWYFASLTWNKNLSI